ncbi:MAG: hypothetical protein EOO96_04655, partial [Pedobacter sp.]
MAFIIAIPIAWLAMENALIQDGTVPTIGAAGGSCRFTQIDLASGIHLFVHGQRRHGVRPAAV